MNLQKLAGVQNANPGQTCSIAIPAGPTYDRILLNLAGATATLARITNPRLEVNGKPIMSWPGLTLAEVDSENVFHGLDAAIVGPPVQIAFHFRRPEVKGGGLAAEINAERLTALRTGDAGPIYLKFDIAAAYVDASPANITAQAVIVPGVPEPMGLFRFVRAFGPYNLNAGANAILDLPKVGRLISIHAVRNDITEVSLKRNRLALIDLATKAALQLDQNADSRVPNRASDAGRTVIDFCGNGNLDEAVSIDQYDPQNACRDLELDLTSTAGGATFVIVEGLATYGQL